MTWVVTITEPFASITVLARDVTDVWVDGAKAPDMPMELELELSPLVEIGLDADLAATTPAATAPKITKRHRMPNVIQNDL